MTKRDCIKIVEEYINTIIGSNKKSSDVMTTSDGTIYFTSYDTYLYTIQTNQPFEELYFTNKLFPEEALTGKMDDKMLDYICRELEVRPFDIGYYRKMHDIVNEYIHNPGPRMAWVEGMQQFDVYKDVLNVKTIEGLKHCRVPSIENPEVTFDFSLYNGLIKVNKSDSVDLNIYNHSEFHFLYQLIIHKKSFPYPIQLIYKTMKM